MKDNMKYVEVPCNMKNVVIIKLVDQDIFIFCVYRPPGSSYSNSENTLLVDTLREFCGDKEVIILGDFNLPTLRWDADDPAAGYITQVDRLFLDMFTDAGLTQIVKESTNFPSGNIIDLCLLTHAERMSSTSVLPPLPACSHGVILLQYTFQGDSPASRAAAGRVWTKGNYGMINDRLCEYDWEYEFAGLDTQEKYSRLLTIVSGLVNLYVPVSDHDKSKPPWTLNPPRNLTRRKSNLFSNYKDVRSAMGRRHPETLAAWQDFVSANNDIKQFAIQSQKSYEITIAGQLKENPKLFHAYLKHKRVERPKIGPLKLDDDTITDNPKLMAEKFSSSFASVFTVTTPSNPAPNETCPNLLADTVVTPVDVEQEIRTLNVNSSMGADGMHPRLLSRCASSLAYPLCTIFNASLQEGVLPQEWLQSQIVPIFKKNARLDPLNYRPVAITSVPCKTLEKVLVSRLTPYLESNNLLSEHQFGFRSQRSTVDQLILTYDDITKEVDHGQMVDLIFFDFSKAFDTVCHNILIQKLRAIGVSQQLTNWIQQFLVARSMQVRVHGTVSCWRPVTSGVPQGSVLGPVLFLVYVNHVVQRLSCNFKIFADDIKLYISNLPLESTTNIVALQQDIDTLSTTSSSWGLEMNVSKCVCLRFGPRSVGNCSDGVSPYNLNGEVMKFAACHKDLGVRIDRNLKFHGPIRKTANTCNGMTTNMLSSTLCREPSFILPVYKSLIRPKLEYGSPVWNLGYKGCLRALERVQRRWTRQVRGLEELPYSERLRRLDLFSVQGRLLRADLILTWKIFEGKCGINPAQVFQLDASSRRGHSRKLFLPRVVREVRKRFFSIRVVHPWNALAEETVVSSSINKFKNLLCRDLGQQLFDYEE